MRRGISICEGGGNLAGPDRRATRRPGSSSLLLAAALLALGAMACGDASRPQADGAVETTATEFSAADFERLLHTFAEAWNRGDARAAAACFTEDAVYTEPPDKQVYLGRQALFEFFGGGQGRPGQMSMTWHHLVFDPATGVGAGEFSFTYGSTVHGVTMIKIRDGLISNWREYWYESPLEWEAFIGPNRF